MFNTMRGWFGMPSKRGGRPQVKASAHIRVNLEALEARLSPSVTPFNPLQTTKSGGNTVAILGNQPTLNVTTQAATDHIIVKFNQPTSFAASLGVMGEQLADKVFKVRRALTAFAAYAAANAACSSLSQSFPPPSSPPSIRTTTTYGLQSRWSKLEP